MSESTINIFLHHIGHIRDDICNSKKNNQPGTYDNTPNNHLFPHEQLQLFWFGLTLSTSIIDSILVDEGWHDVQYLLLELKSEPPEAK